MTLHTAICYLNPDFFFLQIRFKQGIEMLKIFKNHTMKTSLLDDFIYYENRQRIMQDEKTRLLIKSYESPFFVPALDPPRKLNFVIDLPLSEGKITKQTDVKSSEKPVAASIVTDQASLKSDDLNCTSMNDKCGTAETKNDTVSTLKIGSLTINPKQVESKPMKTAAAAAPPPPASTVVGTEAVDVVTVGTMPIKVNGFTESPGLFTFGTIPLDPRKLQFEKGGVVLGKNGHPH